MIVWCSCDEGGPLYSNDAGGVVVPVAEQRAPGTDDQHILTVAAAVRLGGQFRQSQCVQQAHHVIPVAALPAVVARELFWSTLLLHCRWAASWCRPDARHTAVAGDVGHLWF